MAPQEYSVLTVCLGICRSPMAEAVLAHEARKRDGLKLTIDSAGTGAYHCGSGPDERTVAVCRKYKVPINCVARQVKPDDYNTFDYILAMDESNLQVLQNRKPRGSKARIALFGAFDPNLMLASPGSRLRAQAIEDPYYGGRDGFETCFEQCTRFARGFLDFLEAGGGDVPRI